VIVFLAINLTLPIRASVPLQPLYQGEKTQKETIYFTFNVLWEKEPVEDVWKILEDSQIKGLFFATGEWIEGNTELAQKIVLSGHSFGNHTYSHRRLPNLTEDDIIDEIQGFNQVCHERLKYQPTFFRPPYGEYNARIISLAHEHGCITLLWDINALMLSNYESELILSRLEERLHDGAVILFHTSAPLIGESLPHIINFLQWKGYRIGSPDEIIG
jgi:peptidoglycan/xylan/chitin deacetylase (PgdA/CDA1 family)